jgi:DNA-binding transcriptional LysR family regulator
LQFDIFNQLLYIFLQMQNLDWTLCRSFLEVLRQGSLTQAARQLGLTHPTVKRHIDEMEGQLGLKLFTRSQSGLAPTDRALNLKAAAETMEAAFSQIIRVASQRDNAISGTVRFTASDVIGHEVLPPILATLKKKHPALAIELNLSNKDEDILRRDADIAIRMHRPTQSALVARLIGKVEIGLFAHRTWLKARGTPKSLEALIAQQCLIGYDRDQAILTALRKTGFKLDRNAFAFRSDNDLAQLAALRAGFGPGMCQVPLAVADPRLERILPALKHQMEMWLVTHADQRASPRIRAVLDHVAHGLSAYAKSGEKQRNKMKNA